MQKMLNKNMLISSGKTFNNCTFRRRKNTNIENYTNLDKILFSRLFKFNLAIENSDVEGYHTEKIIEAFISRSIPIYWGNKSIEKEFNKHSFININDFNSLDQVVDFISNMPDQDYLDMLNYEDKLLKYDYLVQLKTFLLTAIDGPVFEHRYGAIGYIRKTRD